MRLARASRRSHAPGAAASAGLTSPSLAQRCSGLVPRVEAPRSAQPLAHAARCSYVLYASAGLLAMPLRAQRSSQPMPRAARYMPGAAAGLRIASRTRSSRCSNLPGAATLVPAVAATRPPDKRLRARPASQLPTRRGGRLSPHVASDSAPRVAAACSALPLTRFASRPRARRCRRHASRRSHSRDVATDSRLSSHLRAGHYNRHTSRRSPSLSAATGQKLGAAAGPRLAARPRARQCDCLAPRAPATRPALRLARASRRRHSRSGAADSFRASRLRGQRNH